MNLINSNIDKLTDLCKKHKVAKLFVFGSAVEDRFDKEDYANLLVEINMTDSLEKGETLLSLWDKLEELLNRKIRLVTESSVKNPYFLKMIETSKVLIYDTAGETGRG